jgi:hypothetical protein
MTPATKPFWQSKTVWLQALALLAAFIPAVAEWVKTNPVEFVAALAALNTLVRFATHGSVSIFQDGDDDGDDAGSGNGAASGGGLLLAMIATAAGFAMAGGLLSSCAVGVDAEGNYTLRPDPNSIDAVLRHAIRHEADEAKGGLTRWEYFDPATGEKIDPKDYAAWGIEDGR